MFFIGKLFTFLILPPGGFVVLALFVGAFAYQRTAKLASTIAYATALLIYLCSIRPVADTMLAPLESVSLRADTGTEQPTAIVVLGGGTVSTRFSDRGDRELSHGSLPRVIEAFKLYRDTGTPLVISGGSGLSRDEEPEAMVARRLLTQLGVPEEEIGVEPESRSTWENAKLVSTQVPNGPIYLVTSAFHMRRALESFASFGVKAVPVAADYRSEGPPYDVWDFLPSPNGLDDSTAALKEYLGRMFYRIRHGRDGYRLRVTATDVAARRSNP